MRASVLGGAVGGAGVQASGVEDGSPPSTPFQLLGPPFSHPPGIFQLIPTPVVAYTKSRL